MKNYTKFFLSLYLFLSLIFLKEAFAIDFGVSGHVYCIQEQSFINMIKERLEKVDMLEHQSKMKEMARDYALKPKPITRVTKAVKNRTYYWDPTYVVKNDIILPCGDIMHKSGTSVNPLKHMKFDIRMLFLDSRDETQVAWLESELARGKYNSTLRNKIILVGGEPLVLKENLRNNNFDYEVYFDQLGDITSRLGIKGVPSSAVAEGYQIRIDEYAVE